MIIDDSWAEDELERQLRCLTPIECLVEAEKKLDGLHLTYDDLYQDYGSNNNLTLEKEGTILPDSVELFFSVIRNATDHVETELQECQDLVNRQYELTENSELEDLDTPLPDEYQDEENPGENEDEWLLENSSSSVGSKDSSDEDDIQKVLKLTQSYKIIVPKSVPIFEAEPLRSIHVTPENLSSKLKNSNPQYNSIPVKQETENIGDIMRKEKENEDERRAEARIFEEERVRKGKERASRLEKEKRRLELLQKEQMRKLEEEMVLAEEELKKELWEHEEKLRKMEELQKQEKMRHAEEKRKQEEKEKKRKMEAASRIQAHFRGMRTRQEYGKILEKKIAQKRKELLAEQLQYYEEVIRQEKAAVEAKLRKREEEEHEKRRKERRAEEIKQRHLEKERIRKEEEARAKAELEERERQKKKEEEERIRLETERQLHWLQNEQKQQREEKHGLKIGVWTPDIDTKQTQDTCGNHADQNDNNSTKINDDPSKENLNTPVSNKNYKSSIHDNLNKKVLPINDNNEKVSDDKEPSIDQKDFNIDNGKKDKRSFLGNIASKAKNLFKSNSSSTDAPWTSNEILKNSIDASTTVDQSKATNSGETINQPETTNNEGTINKEWAVNTDADNLKTMNTVEKVNASDMDTFNNTKFSNPGYQDGNTGTVENVNLSKTSVTGASKSMDYIIQGRTMNSQKDLSKNGVSENESDKHEAKSTDTENTNKRNANTVQSSLIDDTTPRNNSDTRNLPTFSGTLLHTKNTSVLNNATNLRTSVDSALSSKPPIPVLSPVSKSIEIPKSPVPKPPETSKVKSSAAKAEYRRKKKLRDDIHLAQELERETTLVKSEITEIKKDWAFFVEYFTQKCKCWSGSDPIWNPNPPPPRTAGSARQISRKYSELESHVINNTTLIEGRQTVTIHNPDCDEVFLRDCVSVEVSIASHKPKSLSLDNCSDTNLLINESQLVFVSQTHCQLKTLPKLPASVLELNVMHNSVSRLDPLSCSNLTSLNLAHNKLVSTRGLQYLPKLLHLDLSFNNLTTVHGIEKCGLLLNLNLSNNRLANIPSLANNILLTKLDLSNNGLTSVDKLSSCWLPCLKTLILASNGLCTLPLLYQSTPMLKYLDISGNMFSVNQIIDSLEWLVLQELLSDLSSAPSVGCSEGPEEVLEIVYFSKIQTILSNTESVYLSLCDKEKYLKKRCDGAMRYREDILNMNFDINLDKTSENKTPEHAPEHKTPENKIPEIAPEYNTPENKIPEIATEYKTPENKIPEIVTEYKTPEITAIIGNFTSTKCVSPDKSDGSDAEKQRTATMLQSLVRGFRSRLRFRNMCDQRRQHVYMEYQRLARAAVHVQRIWRGYTTRKMLWNWLPWLHRRQQQLTTHHNCATKIQACYRGYLLRRRFSEALRQVAYDLSDVEFDDIGSLQWNEDEIDHGWDLPPTPILQNNAPLPPTPISPQRLSSRNSANSSVIKHVVSDYTQPPVPLLPLNKIISRTSSRANSLRSVSDISILSLPPSRKTSTTKLPIKIKSPSRRESDMAAEWGVKNIETVQKLIQRSKKFGTQMSAQKKREFIRKRILEGSHKSRQFTPPPPSVGSAISVLSTSDVDSVEYQWDVSPLKHSPNKSKRGIPLHTQIYRNPKFSQPTNTMRLPPLQTKKPEKPKFSVFKNH